jgi:hypothetical protein
VAQSAQETRDELPVEGGVVDDEDAPGLGDPVTGGWGHAGPPVAAFAADVGRVRAIAASSSSGRMGLLT